MIQQQQQQQSKHEDPGIEAEGLALQCDAFCLGH